MARIFITGSADGIGHAAGRGLVARGHEVVLLANSKLFDVVLAFAVARLWCRSK